MSEYVSVCVCGGGVFAGGCLQVGSTPVRRRRREHERLKEEQRTSNMQRLLWQLSLFVRVAVRR